MARAGRKKIFVGGDGASLLSSVERTLSLIELLSHKGSIGVSEVARTLGTGKSTAYRMLITLEKKGFVCQSFETGNYCLAEKVFRIASNALRNSQSNLERLRASLRKLAWETGENALFATINAVGDAGLVLLEELAPSPLIARPLLFETIPLLKSALGILYFASFLPYEREERISALIKREGLSKKANEIRRRINDGILRFSREHYVFSDCVMRPGVSTIAVSLTPVQGVFNGVIALSGPKSSYKAKNIKQWVSLLRKEVEIL